MFHIVLIEPEIPHNAGAAGRLALATGSTLHLVEPLGFSLDDKHVRRTGLDYWHEVDLRVWKSFGELQAAATRETAFWFLSTKAGRTAWSAPF
ncbi:MAG TPA: TrmH family RNA methyltransferase, partial [Luteolibacter sp.]|nr:TrmH family RNA methyltransferase [Luteolibacter sp.]